MTFTQLTFTENPGDVKECLDAAGPKFHRVDHRTSIAIGTLADANKMREWSIHTDATHRLIAQTCGLCDADELLGMELNETATPWVVRRSITALRSFLGPGEDHRQETHAHRSNRHVAFALSTIRRCNPVRSDCMYRGCIPYRHNCRNNTCTPPRFCTSPGYRMDRHPGRCSHTPLPQLV